jgi:hypothetical protein
LGRAIVRTAEVQITDDDDLVGRLTDMRVWLDGNRFEPSSFTYFDLDPGMRIRVLFKIDAEAEAFAYQFGGFLLDAYKDLDAHKDVDQLLAV